MRKRLVPLEMLLIPMILLAGCDSQRTAGPRSLTTVVLVLESQQMELGQIILAVASGLDQYGQALPDAGAVTYASAAAEIAAVNAATGQVLGKDTGTVDIIASIGGKTARQSVTVVKAPIRINEIKPDAQGDRGWVEIFNPTAAAVDLSGWTITTSDPLLSVRLPAGSIIAAGDYFVVEEADFPGGFQPADALHLFSRFASQVDTYSWSADGPRVVGRCPDGTGSFIANLASTRAAANACPQF